jgi:hypothetical protein
MTAGSGVSLFKAMALAILLVVPTRSQVLLSEFMASNTQTLADEDGDYSDWIELINIGHTNVDLTGWTLSDDSGDLKRWKFSKSVMTPGQTLVVFASGKDRNLTGSPLHTNFKLSSKGGFLGLANPEGVLVSSFGTSYPQQIPDVSFGFPAETITETIFQTNSPLKFLVPTDSSLDELWPLREYDDSSWANGFNGIGFDLNSPGPGGWTNSILEQHPLLYFRFEESNGTTATNQGTLGAAQNATYIAGTLLNQTGLRPPEADGLPSTNMAIRFDGKDDYVSTRTPTLSNLGSFTMVAWVRPSALTKSRVGLWGQHDAIEVGFIDPTLLQVSTAGGGTVQASYPFPVNEWHLVAVTGDGETLAIYFDGTRAASGGNLTGNYGSSLYPFVIGGGGIFDSSENWFLGNIDEFALFDRAFSSEQIYFVFQSAKQPFATFRDTLATDVSTLMHGDFSSIYLRNYFSLEASDFDGLLLRAQFDDGFVAYLNGVPVISENAPAETAWDSSAILERAAATGLQWKEYDLSPEKGLLQEGPNLLAVQGLNRNKDDADFYFSPELVGLRRKVFTNSYRYFIQPTPGEINGPGDQNIGPLIVDESHSPQLPTDNDAIAIRARMIQTVNPTAALTLTYRIMFGAETTIAMQDDGLHNDFLAGDGIYGAIIPAEAASSGQMVRWYLRGTDSTGAVTRWPPYRDTRNSPQYLGTMIANPALTNPLPVLHWFVQSTTGAETATGTRSSVFWDGTLYDNIFVNLHGQSSQSFPKKSYNFDFNSGYHFAYAPAAKPVEDINLLTTYPDKSHLRNILAYETFRDSGHPYHFVIPVRVQRNGSFFSDAHIVEDGDADYLERVGLDPHGALYKMYNSLDSSTSGVEKKTRKFENNTDLQQLIAGLNLTGTARTAFIYDNVDIPGMVNYLAALVVTGNVDCCHKNYYLFRDSEGNGQWKFLPWDLDLSFGRNWTQAKTYYDDFMYYNNGLYIGNGNKLPSALFAVPAIKQMYLKRLRTLLDQLMQPADTAPSELRYEQRIRQLYTLISPDAALDYAKWPTWGTPQTMPQALAIMTNQYMPQRRTFLYSQRDLPQATPTNALPISFGPLEFNPSSGLQQHEYLTLKNPNGFAIDLSGWKIEGAVEMALASGTVLPANGLLYLSPDVNAFRQRLSSPKGGQGLFVQGNYNGQLSARGEVLVLRDNIGNFINSVNYAGEPTAAQQFLRVVEIMYAPSAVGLPGIAREELEYIVLKNIGPANLNLTQAGFSSGITYIFDDLILKPSEKVYLARNPELFKSYYGTNFLVVGPYLGQLANEGERLVLHDEVGEQVLDFTYSNQWYPLSESQGYSLMIVDEKASYSDWGKKSSWTLSPFGGGSAGASRAWNDFQAVYFSLDELGNTAISGPLADADSDSFSNYSEFLVGTNPRDGSSNLQFQISTLGPGVFELNYTEAMGRVYSVWGTENLSSPNWVELSRGNRSTHSGPAQLQYSIQAEQNTQYFQLKVEL